MRELQYVFIKLTAPDLSEVWVRLDDIRSVFEDNTPVSCYTIVHTSPVEEYRVMESPAEVFDKMAEALDKVLQ